VTQSSSIDDGKQRAIERDDLILRDVLAIDRTILANERTILAYFRTMLALLAAGASLIHFIDAWWALPGGVVLLALGPFLFGFGVWRYRRVNRDLRRVREPFRGKRF
jgi:putative membrane protein